MLKVFIYAVFFATNTGEPTLVKGWYPFELPSMDVCISAYDKVNPMVDLTTKANPKLEGYEVGCIKAEDLGDAIKRIDKIYNKGPRA